MANKDTDPFGFSEGAKMALEQTHQAMDTYFDFLKKSISAFPSGGTEIGDRWKEQSLLNLTAFQELVKRLSTAGSLEEALRIQAAFMHSQLNRLGKQTTSLGSAYTKTADNADKKRPKESSDKALVWKSFMPRFYQPDLGSEPDSPFARDANNKLVRRGYWLDMNDRSLVMVMTQGIGAHLTNDEKRAHLTDLKREHLIDQVCIQEILPPEDT